jgi:hypothetical protein
MQNLYLLVAAEDLSKKMFRLSTTMNVYGDAMTADMAEAHGKIVALALNGSKTDRKAS